MNNDYQEPHQRNNNFFAGNSQRNLQNQGDQMTGNYNENSSQYQLDGRQNSNEVQQFDDFNDNINEVVGSDQNLERQRSNKSGPNGLLSVDDDVEESNLKSSYKSDNEQLNQKPQNHNRNTSNDNQYDNRGGNQYQNNYQQQHHHPPAPPPPHNNYNNNNQRNNSPNGYQDDEQQPMNYNNNKQNNQHYMPNNNQNYNNNPQYANERNPNALNESAKEPDYDNQGKKSQNQLPSYNQSGPNPVNKGPAKQQQQQQQYPNQPHDKQGRINSEQNNPEYQSYSIPDSHHKLKSKLDPIPNQQNPKAQGYQQSQGGRFSQNQNDDNYQGQNQNYRGNPQQQNQHNNQQQHHNEDQRYNQRQGQGQGYNNQQNNNYGNNDNYGNNNYNNQNNNNYNRNNYDNDNYNNNNNQYDDNYHQQQQSRQQNQNHSKGNQNTKQHPHQQELVDVPPKRDHHDKHTKHADHDKKEDDQPKEELDPKFDEPMHPFSISRNDLIRVASAAQQRHFCEEVDLLESMGGIGRFAQGLITDFKKGISATEEDLKHRDDAFSNNLKEVSPPKGLLELFLGALDDFTMKVLLFAAVFSIAIEVGTASDSHRSTAWIEGFAVLVAVFVCASVTAVNDYQKERQFQSLNTEADKRKIITVIRKGEKINVHQSLVMVGDLVDLIEGMEIPADGLVLEASELTTDESAMTGETVNQLTELQLNIKDPLKKSTLADCIKKRDVIINMGAKNTSTSHDVPSPIVLSGTKILTGAGKMLIIVVGEYSCVGKISKILNTKEQETTPLQEKLEAIAMDIGTLGLKSAIAIVGVLFIRFTIEKIIENEWDHSHDWAEMLQFFIIGITVVVVAIPEGLPLSVTLSLAYSVKKMLNDKNLVRKLQACETMGGADCICSDKTGTLTQNIMTLTTWWNEEIQEFDKYSEKDRLENYIQPNQKFFQKLFLQSCAINTSADLRPAEKGSKTEVAVLKLLEKFDEKYEKWREQYEPELCFPFSSARKRMSSVINSDGKRIILVKGASEMVLAACNKVLSKRTGQIRKIDDEQLLIMKNAIKSMADNALRTIVLAYKELKDNEDLETKDNLGVFDVETKDLTCLAIFGIKDILRPEVPDAVKRCQDAGIKVRMVTGDNSDTARAIARDCNILTKTKKPSPYQVIEGVEFIKLTGGIVCKKCQTFECDCVRDSEQAEKEKKSLRVDTIKNGDVFDKIYKEIDVMARSRPEDKYAMVVGLIERKHIVAVTGDGTNDAPALKKADVGFAMGMAGTEVARGAAAIILLDDNFKSIVAAVLWGRNIYDSIKKFLQFQLTVNICAVVITLIGAAVIKQQVLQPIQMLWINLIMDTFASLALATEPPNEELLLRKPHNRDEYIVSKKMFKHVIGQAIYQLIILMILVFKGETFLPEDSDSFDNEIRDNKLYDNNPDNWWKAKYHDKERTLVCSGRFRSYNGVDKDYQVSYDEYQQPSRHFTAIFNIFVWMQIFNFLNARKLQDELNIFEGILKNMLFFIIVILIMGLQVLLVSVGGIPFACYKLGLNGGNWGISIGFGFGSLVWGFCLKFISEDKCAQFGTKKINPLQNQSRILSLKGSRGEASMSRRYSAIIQHPVPIKH